MNKFAVFFALLLFDPGRQRVPSEDGFGEEFRTNRLVTEREGAIGGRFFR